MLLEVRPRSKVIPPQFSFEFSGKSSDEKRKVKNCQHKHMNRGAVL